MLQKIIAEFEKIDEVDSILLSGSMTNGTFDENSDFDLYVYVTGEIPVEKRSAIYDLYCKYMEVNNRFWETEDTGVLLDNREIEFVFRDYKWMEEMLHRVVEENLAEIGYTTCFWNNLMSSKILFDRNGKAEDMKNRFDIDYSSTLQKNIVSKNLPLLNGIANSYLNQIKKAIKRGDIISVNHRVSAFFASYFDIIFAINKVKHPGEKKLLSNVNKMCPLIPEGFDKVNLLIEKSSMGDMDTLEIIEEMDRGLKKLLEKISL